MIAHTFLFLLTAAPSPSKPMIDAASRSLNRGDFAGAQRQLEMLLSDTLSESDLARVQLLRAQAFGAMSDFNQAEAALSAALEADPLSTLDAAKVDPSLVRLLESLRQRLSGGVWVRSEGAVLVFVGNDFTADAKTGEAQVKAPVGENKIRVMSYDGWEEGMATVVVKTKSKKPAEVFVPLKPRTDTGPNKKTPSRPFAQVRAFAEPAFWGSGISFEMGLGQEWKNVRAMVDVRIFPVFGLAPRADLWVAFPESDFQPYVEVEIPLIFYSTVAAGLGGALGVEYAPSQWLGFFLQGGARHFFVGPPSFVTDRLNIMSGLRLRLP